MESLGCLLVGTIFGTSGSTMSNDIHYDEKALATQNDGLSQTMLLYSAELLPFQSRMDPWDGPDALDPNDTQWTTVARDQLSNRKIAYPAEAFQVMTFN
jgi:hypothetical protein